MLTLGKCNRDKRKNLNFLKLLKTDINNASKRQTEWEIPVLIYQFKLDYKKKKKKEEKGDT